MSNCCYLSIKYVFNLDSLLLQNEQFATSNNSMTNIFILLMHAYGAHALKKSLGI